MDTAMTNYPLPVKHKIDRGDRQFDKTQLRERSYAQQVHRDYAAHYFRWGFAKNFIKNGTTVLEVGCGQDMPLPRVLTASMAHVPKRYVGCDMNSIKKPLVREWIELLDEFDFTSRHKEIEGTFDVIVCFEVIEHMSKEDGKKLLKAIKAKMHSDSVFLMSTPVYNEKHMAANHIHEYRRDELQEHIESVGLTVLNQFGTFMTSQAIKKVATPQELELIETLHEFYGWDVLANFLAPKYPEAASNICWKIGLAENDPRHDF